MGDVEREERTIFLTFVFETNAKDPCGRSFLKLNLG